MSAATEETWLIDLPNLSIDSRLLRRSPAISGNLQSALGRLFFGGNICRWDETQHLDYFIQLLLAEIDMLVLRRRKGEEIIVNERMRIVVIETSDGSCSLAFDAPASDRIRRAELPPFQEAIVQRTASALRVQQ